ncbi:recF/RecN/SMC N terminal domain-containing protein isoform X1 [Senna tora]|uniref:RecF/RecN/SMC N terminal domain-containing protein isoform X1 n=1 Tax=Senna tora TaxID=362788 RepID=A0A834TJP3_9FABA|nr:recF/RecN/SMC N terminal domain-containing protein isoform X1 [Senna tora]
MEALYSKLYDKYTKLKAKKLSELDQLNKDQEVKFMNYLSAAEELIEHLKTENNQLHEQVNDLRNEVASIRLAKDKEVADYQRLAMEESKKTDETLLEEIEKFRQEGTSSDLKQNNNNILEDDQVPANSNTSSKRKTRKRIRDDASEKIVRSTPSENGKDNSVVREPAVQNLCKETVIEKQMECCTGANDQSGVNLQGSNWLIQALFEHVVGMKLSTDYQTGRVCISAQHQSSGYSFSLTWVSKAPEEEAELLYHVLSLGTFERVAPEWMREDIMFSTTMCPIFFERISRVIKLRH